MYYGLIYHHLNCGLVLCGAWAKKKRKHCSLRHLITAESQRLLQTFVQKFVTVDVALPLHYILETTLSVSSKCPWQVARSQNMNTHETRGKENYHNGSHKRIVFEHLPSQVKVHLINKPNSIKNVLTPKALRTLLYAFLRSMHSTITTSIWQLIRRSTNRKIFTKPRIWGKLLLNNNDWMKQCMDEISTYVWSDICFNIDVYYNN